MTAVEWFFMTMNIRGLLPNDEIVECYEQAKEMEKQRYAEIMSEIDQVVSVLETTDNIYCIEKLKKIRNL